MTCPLHKDRERLLNIHGDETEFTVQYVHLRQAFEICLRVSCLRAQNLAHNNIINKQKR